MNKIKNGKTHKLETHYWENKGADPGIGALTWSDQVFSYPSKGNLIVAGTLAAQIGMQLTNKQGDADADNADDDAGSKSGASAGGNLAVTVWGHSFTVLAAQFQTPSEAREEMKELAEEWVEKSKVGDAMAKYFSIAVLSIQVYPDVEDSIMLKDVATNEKAFSGLAQTLFPNVQAKRIGVCQTDLSGKSKLGFIMQKTFNMTFIDITFKFVVAGIPLSIQIQLIGQIFGRGKQSHCYFGYMPC